MTIMPFDIKLRPQIESGEYKLLTSFGEPAEIVKWDCKGQYPLLACIFDGHTDDAGFYTEEGKRVCNSKEDYLFIVTPEPELSEFELKVKYIVYNLTNNITYRNVMKERFNRGDEDEQIKEYASELLTLARKELEPEVLERLEAAYKNQDEVVYENGKRDRKAEALNDLPRWRKEQGEMELVAYGIIGGGVASQENPRVYLNGYSIDLYSLEKLPKED